VHASVWCPQNSHGPPPTLNKVGKHLLASCQQMLTKGKNTFRGPRDSLHLPAGTSPATPPLPFFVFGGVVFPLGGRVESELEFKTQLLSEYRTGPTPSLDYFDFCCGQGEFLFLSARRKLATACGEPRSHTNAIKIIVESLWIGSCGQV